MLDRFTNKLTEWIKTPDGRSTPLLFALSAILLSGTVYSVKEMLVSESFTLLGFLGVAGVGLGCVGYYCAKKHNQNMMAAEVRLVEEFDRQLRSLRLEHQELSLQIEISNIESASIVTKYGLESTKYNIPDCETEKVQQARRNSL